jgi:hypothetical protein
MLQATTLIIFLTYVVAGAIPPTLAAYVLRTRFLGGAWAAIAVGVIAAFLGGLADSLFLDLLGDMLVIGRAVDVVPPLVASTVFTVAYGLISRSNRRAR